MKMNRNKILTLTLAVAMVATLAACGTKPSSSSSSSMSSTPPAASPSSEPSSLPSSDSVPAADQNYDAAAQRYGTAITGARDAEINDAYGIFTHDANYNMSSFRKNYADMKKEDGTPYTEEEMLENHNSQSDMLFGMLGFTAADVESYAFSISPMNTRAYGIAVVKPVAGKEELVLKGLNSFVETQRKNFETYLADQYEIAKGGYVKTLEDGTMIMVMTEKPDAVFESISKGIAVQ